MKYSCQILLKKGGTEYKAFDKPEKRRKNCTCKPVAEKNGHMMAMLYKEKRSFTKLYSTGLIELQHLDTRSVITVP